MMSIIKSINQHLKTHNLQDKKLLVLCSGGVDSQVLLFGLSQIMEAENLASLYINHKTRPENEREAKMVEDLSNKLGILYIQKEIEAKATKNKENTWRKERIRIKKEVLADLGFDFAITAHHATDLVETVLLRMIKGGGISAMSPFEVQTKPLWQVSKAEIVEYAKEKQIPWAEDPSNNDQSYDRNKIRDILPTFRAINPNLEQVFVNNSLRFADLGKILDEMTENYEKEIEKEAFLALNPYLQGEWIRKNAPKAPSGAEIKDFMTWISQNPEGNTKKAAGGATFIYQKGVISLLEDVVE